MPKTFNLSEDAALLLRFGGLVLLAIWAAASFAMIVAMMFRDWQVATFFDQWFASWSDLQLTLVACGMFGVSFLGVKWAARSQQHARESEKS